MTWKGLETRSGRRLIKLSFVFQIDSSADVNVRSLNIKQDGLATPLILASRFDKLYCAYQKNQVWQSSLFLLFALFVAVLEYLHLKLNRPRPSSKNPHFQNEAKGATFLVKMSFIGARMKNNFRIKDLALNLVLIERLGGTRKWLIVQQTYSANSMLCPIQISRG